MASATCRGVCLLLLAMGASAADDDLASHQGGFHHGKDDELESWTQSLDEGDKFAGGNFEPCDSKCEINGVSATCGDRIEYSAQHEFWGMDDKCEQAHKRVSKQCNSTSSGTCGRCSVKASGCHAKFHWNPAWGSTTTPGPTTTGSKGCLTMCELDGKSGTCREHIQMAAKLEYSLAPISCSLAYAWVLEKCAHCSVCPTIHAGCTTAPPPPTTTRTSSTSTVTPSTTATNTSTLTITSSTSSLTSTSVSSTTTSKTGTTITTSTTVTSTTVTSVTSITSTSTTTPKPWYSFMGIKDEQVEEEAVRQPSVTHSGMLPLLGLGFIGSGLVIGAIVARRRNRVTREEQTSQPWRFLTHVRSVADPELAEALDGLE